jgi:hypothetical protein
VPSPRDFHLLILFRRSFIMILRFRVGYSL